MRQFLIIISMVFVPTWMAGQNLNWSAGVEFVPVGAYGTGAASIGGGVSGSFDYTVLPKFSIGINTGYIYLNRQQQNWFYFVLETGPYHIVPVEITTRYYFREYGTKSFVGLRAGVQFFSVDSRNLSSSNSETNTANHIYFGFTPEYGYHFSPKFSSSIRMQYAFQKSTTETTENFDGGLGGGSTQTTSVDFNALVYISLRMAYHF